MICLLLDKVLQKIFNGLIVAFNCQTPTEILNGILMSTEHVTIKVNFFVHILNIFAHFSCISFEKSSNTSHKESVSSKGTWMWVEFLDFFALDGCFCNFGIIFNKAALKRLKAEDCMAPSMTWNMNSLDTTVTNLKLLTRLDSIVTARNRLFIQFSDHYFYFRTRNLQLFRQLVRLSCMIPMLMCIKHMRNGILREVSGKIVHDYWWNSRVNQDQTLLGRSWDNVRIIISKERKSYDFVELV